VGVSQPNVRKPDVSKAGVERALGEARDATLALLEPVPVEDQARQVSPLMSPLCWDLGHVAHFEELWLLRELVGAAPTEARFDDVYDAFKHPRRERPDLDLLDPSDARTFAADVRKRALDVLATVPLDGSNPLLADLFVYGMIVQHEHQHRETMLATVQLMEDFEHPLLAAAHPEPCEPYGRELAVGDGTAALGTDEAPWAYDNERPAHEALLAPYRIDAIPVTNEAYAAFVADGGYGDHRLWSEAGWAWRQEAGLEAPQFWRREGDGAWSRVRFGRREPVPPHEPVQHVCWYEADAFARWAAKRLPTESEWEHAGVRRAGVWEWTSTDFGGYPGFAAFPYREYSEVFFGSDYKVLRGGSWAAHPTVARPTFRNWDYPIRRQIFAGFRCARDA